MTNKNLEPKETALKMHKFGWLPDLPDERDYVYEAPMKLRSASDFPSKVDLRKICPPVFNQGELGSCTANSLLAAVECCKRLQGQKKTKRLSRLFLYYNERVMMDTVLSDSGAYLRDGVKSLNKQGVCLEKDWTYSKSTKPGAKYTKEPPKECYEAALDNQILSYWRINANMFDIRACLADGYPFVFGFSVYSSFMSEEVAKTGIMPMPEKGESMLGGHAVMAAGYDNDRRLLLVRNSWGKEWGDKGYFWMPYDYISKTKNCSDFWTIRLVE